MQTAYVCNGCKCDLPTSTQMLATFCGHGYCLSCAQDISAAGAGCPICGQELQADNVTICRIRDSDPEVATALHGLAKKDILRVSTARHPGQGCKQGQLELLTAGSACR